MNKKFAVIQGLGESNGKFAPFQQLPNNEDKGAQHHQLPESGLYKNLDFTVAEVETLTCVIWILQRFKVTTVHPFFVN